MGKNKSASAAMAGNKTDASKVDPCNVINVKYDDIPEEDRQAFEAQLKQQEEEARKNLLSCYGRTRNEVVKKAEFSMPSFQSTSSTSNVSVLPQSMFDLFLSESGKKLEDSQKVTQDMLFNLSDRMDKIDKGKAVDHTYSTEDLTLETSAAPASTTGVVYCMPPNYSARQTPPPGTVRPPRAEPARPAASAGQTGAVAAGAVRPVQQTGQTGAMVLARATTPPLAPIPISATSG
jgi:hypothetical protein